MGEVKIVPLTQDTFVLSVCTYRLWNEFKSSAILNNKDNHNEIIMESICHLYQHLNTIKIKILR